MIKQASKQAIGILGGTFDPIHLAHIKLAEKVHDAFALDRILFVPCNIPSHKIEPIASASQRLEMLSLALEDLPNFIVDDRDVQRGGVTYTVDTLRSLREDLGDQPALYFIMGMDSFNHLHQWRDYLDILSYANIVVYPRAGVECDQHDSKILDRIKSFEGHSASSGCILLCEGEQWDMSSTAIKSELLAFGTNISDLPPRVVSYINTHQLYQ